MYGIVTKHTVMYRAKMRTKALGDAMMCEGRPGATGQRCHLSRRAPPSRPIRGTKPQPLPLPPTRAHPDIAISTTTSAIMSSLQGRAARASTRDIAIIWANTSVVSRLTQRYLHLRLLLLCTYPRFIRFDTQSIPSLVPSNPRYHNRNGCTRFHVAAP